MFLSGGDLLRQRAGCDVGFGEEDSAHRLAAKDDDEADECGDWIVHEDQEIDGEASGEKQDGRGGIPPATDGLRQAEERA